MTQHIGIVACSAEGASLCYRTICTEGAQLLGPHAHPEVSMHTPSLADYMERIYRDDWKGVGELMLASAEKLARIGADFLICPDNTIHQALPYVEPRSPLPWQPTVRATAQPASARRAPPWGRFESRKPARHCGTRTGERDGRAGKRATHRRPAAKSA